MAVTSMYERLGGMAFFDELVARFYAGVETDEVLRPLYPEDLGPSRRHLALFLAQFWGGPRAYDDQRGSPRLRARHLPFAIGSQEREAWLRHMRAAVLSLAPPPLETAQLLSYFEGAAAHMVNQPAGPTG
jgi:hemoglobin